MLVYAHARWLARHERVDDVDDRDAHRDDARVAPEWPPAPTMPIARPHDAHPARRRDPAARRGCCDARLARREHQQGHARRHPDRSRRHRGRRAAAEAARRATNFSGSRIHPLDGRGPRGGYRARTRRPSRWRRARSRRCSSWQAVALPRVPGAAGRGRRAASCSRVRRLGQCRRRADRPRAAGNPRSRAAVFANLGALVPGALAISIMALLESAAVARGIRKPGEPQIDSNRELLATGAANAVGSFFQTLPSAGGFSQSAVNQDAGARTQLASIVTVVLALLVVIFLAPVLSLLPQATLASLVFVACSGSSTSARSCGSSASVARTSGSPSRRPAIGLTVGLLAAVAVGVVSTLVRGAPGAQPAAGRRRRARRRGAPDPPPRSALHGERARERERRARGGGRRIPASAPSRSSSPGCRSRR